MAKSKMNPQETITLIVPSSAVITEGRRPDRGGGEQHSFGNVIFRDTEPKKVSQDKFERDMEQMLAKLHHLVERVKSKTIDGWEIGEIKVSLAISAEGSIGIVTAGAEAGVEVTFSRRPAKPTMEPTSRT